MFYVTCMYVLCHMHVLCVCISHAVSHACSMFHACLVTLQGRMYTYDHVFQPNSSQDDVYSVSAKPLVKGKNVGVAMWVWSWEYVGVVRTNFLAKVCDCV